MKNRKTPGQAWVKLVPAHLYPAEASAWQKINPDDEIWYNQATVALSEMAEEEAYHNNKTL